MPFGGAFVCVPSLRQWKRAVNRDAHGAVGEALEIAQRRAGDARPIKLENEYALIVARKRG